MMKRNTAQSNGPTAVSGDIRTLMRMLASPAGMTRLRAREALITAGSKSVEALIEALSSPQDIVRWEAAKTLMNIPDVRAAPALVAALEDHESDVRWLAAKALIALGTTGVMPLLAALETSAESLWLREGAHHVLTRIDDPGMTEALLPVIEALDHYEPELVVPSAAKDAMAHLKEMEQVHESQELLR